MDWRMLLWAQALWAVGLCLGLCYTTGGRSYLKHFSFPLLFILLAVPWPKGLEKLVIDGLMGIVATVTVEALNLWGIFAHQQGNVIILSEGAVNIAEACSGIRSFQSTLMGSIFLGELFRLSIAHRIVLGLASCCFSFAFNLVRTLALTYVVNAYGNSALADWHDTTGHLIFGISFTFLFVLAWLLKPKSPIHFPDQKAQHLSARPAIHLVYSWLLLCALPLSYSWYAYRAESMPKQPAWHLNWSVLPSVDVQPLDKALQDILFTTHSEVARWEEESRRWLAYWLTWKSAAASQIAGFHHPGQCLPAAGWQLIERASPRLWEKDGVSLTVLGFTFQNAYQTVHVFDIQWGPDGYDYAQKQGLRTYADRLADAIDGYRHAGKVTLEVACEGYASLPIAETAFFEFLDQCVVLSASHPTHQL